MRMSLMRLVLLSLMTVVVIMNGQAKAQANEMPACGAECLASGLTGSSCDAADSACICADATLQNNVSTCVVQACTIKEALTSRNISSTMCELPVRSNRYLSDVVTGVFMALAVIATAIRCTQFPTQFGVDDVFAIITFVATLPMCLVMFLMTKEGYGQDLWTIPFDSITNILKFTYVAELLYIASIAGVKLAFLFLFLRIFPNVTLRKAIFALMGFVTAFFLAFTFGIAFNCVPVSHIWTNWTGETEGKCLDFNSFGISCSVLNIVMDIAVIVLPLRDIMKLKLTWTRKILVMLMLGTGVFVTVVSIIRLSVIITFTHTTNPTYDNMPTSYWSTIECCTAVVCLNMPAIRRFFKRNLVDPWRSRTQESTTYYDDSPVRVVNKHPPRSLGRSILSPTRAASNWRSSGRTARMSQSDGRRAEYGGQADSVQLVDMDRREG